MVNWLFNHEAVFRAIGAINPRVHFPGTVFLVYPSRRPVFALSRCETAFVNEFRWRAAITGVFRQGKRWGLTFAVTSSEPELIDAQNAERLRTIAAQMERIRLLVRAERCALAGVLPSVLHSRGVPHGTAEAEVAAECVLRAIEEVRRLEGMNGSPLIILGSRGFVGSRLMELLQSERVYAFDRINDAGKNNASPEFPPADLHGERAILVNLTWADVLETYVDRMWKGLVVLNEVYPPPSRLCVQAIGDRGASVHHLAGVEGFAAPPFPGVYSGGVPCCAASTSADLKVLVVRLG
jgi:hypothetical protein